ncbi:MAG: SBBP repeat-containing protein [Candidatus Acidiferrales bacterium]
MNSNARSRAMEFYRHIPMSFEANDGQEDPRIKYSSLGYGYRVFLSEEGVIFAFRAGSKAPLSSLTMKLQGANRAPLVTGVEKLPGKSNYFVGPDPARWTKNVANYARFRYEGVYPGIDVVYYGEDHELEYDFVVQPAARPSDIRILLSGVGLAPTARLDSHGDIELRVRDREVRLHRPVAYQRGRNGEEIPVEAHFVLFKKSRQSISENQEVAFEVGDYDRTQPLVIDPVLAFSTFLGGSSIDTAKAIAVDATGNVYVVGSTFSTDFPTHDPIQPTLHGTDGDAFVTKINAAGSAIVYSTYLGGSYVQQANGVAVDSAGNAYVVGQTASSDFPVTQGAFDTSCSTCGSSNGGVAFVSKIDSTGSQLLYSTYLGGTGGDATGDRGDAIAVDSSGFAYVTGGSYSTDFPTTAGAYQRSRVGGSEQAFVSAFNAAGSALNYSTYLGPGEGFGIAVNASGDAYVGGSAADATFPTTPGAFQTTFGGPSGDDAFITALNSGGSALVYSTFLGGTNEDYAGGIAIDSTGNAYVTGQTMSANFPVKSAYQQSLNGTADAYVAKLNPSGTALLYSTYLGGSADDDGDAIAVDSVGNAYATGLTQSSDFPTLAALQGVYGGSTDAFLIEMDPNGIPLFSSYIGGADQDQGNGIAVDSLENVYLTGITQSDDFPTLNALQPARVGEQDAFVTKFSISTATPSPDFSLAASPERASVPPGQPASFSAVLTPVGGFDQGVSLGCSVQPAGPTCSITPTSLMSTGLSTPGAAVTVSTNAAALSPSRAAVSDNWTTLKSGLRHSLLAGLCAMVLVGFFKTTLTRLRSPGSWASAAILLFLLVLLQACGGGGSGGGGGGVGGTNPGTYTVTVTGTSANLSHSATFTLTVN